MSQRALSQQFPPSAPSENMGRNRYQAGVIRRQGGGSFNWWTGRQPKGPGFMVSEPDVEGITQGITPSQIREYKRGKSFAVGEPSSDPEVHYGAWAESEKPSDKRLGESSLNTNPNPAGRVVSDVSRKYGVNDDIRGIGVKNAQEAAFALRGTPVTAEGHKIEDIANPWGGDVLLHMSDFGKNDVDPRFHPQRASEGHTSNVFSLNEVENPEWHTVAGYTHDSEGKEVPHTYGDVLRTINRGRTMRLRAQMSGGGTP